MIHFSAEEALQFIGGEAMSAISQKLTAAHHQLIHRSGKGNDFLGWLDLPMEMGIQELTRIQLCAEKLRAQSEVVVVIGIGGSYLGARAVIDALQNPFATLEKERKHPIILYAGNSLSEDYHAQLLDLLEHKSYSLIVISKSGTTTEPAIAFRILKQHCEEKYGKEGARGRIVAITDANKGALKQLADNEGYTQFVIPDNVGGRYSVLTPVGLLPIAVAGFDISRLVEGARKMRELLFKENLTENNIALQYAGVRYLLYQNGKKNEILVAYEPALQYFIEWFKQLFGESDGKEGKGVFPTGAIFSTDLHSLGQYIQEGERHLFETVLSVKRARRSISIPYSDENIDNLNYLQEKSLQEINQTAELGTRMAHVAGEVPNMTISIPEISELYIGQLIFFFEFSCAIGGYMLDINPFDQPGVEAYKKNMFKLLKKP